MRVGDLDGKLMTEAPRTRMRGAPGGFPPTGSSERKQPEAPPVEESPFAKVLAGLGKEIDRGETVVRRAASGARGAELGTGDLLALQAGVYRYSEAVDLSAKLVDRATSGVKTVLQGQ